MKTTEVENIAWLMMLFIVEHPMSLLQWMAVVVAAMVGWGLLQWIFTIPWTRQGRTEWRRVRDLTERDPYDYRYDPTLEELNASPRIISRYAGVKLAGLGWQVAGETVRHVMSDTLRR